MEGQSYPKQNYQNFRLSGMKAWVSLLIDKSQSTEVLADNKEKEWMVQ